MEGGLTMTNQNIEDLLLENKRLTERINYLENIAIQKRIQEDVLERWHERFEAIVNSIEDYYFELDIDGRYVSLSGNTLPSYGIDTNIFIGKTQEEILGKEAAKIHVRNNRKVLKGKKAVYEWCLDTKEGRKIFQTSLSPLRNKRGKIIGIIGVGRDITEKKMLSDAMIQEKKEEMLSLVSGGIAHDFNNILTVIKGNCFLGKLNIKQSNFEKLNGIIDEIENACIRAKELTTQLLTFSKKGALETTSLCIEDLIKETVDFSLTGTNVTCNYQFETGLKQVQCNEAQISQVLNNLVVNACHAMDDGGKIDINVNNFTKERSSKFLSKGEYIHIVFRDYGNGILRKDLQRIFDPYFTTKSHGNGLGLALAYSIVNKHGGHISAESQKGRGTAFHIYLPSSKDEILSKKSLKEDIYYGKGTILVMEDEPNIRKLLSEMLKYLGYDVILTKNGFDAVSTYRSLLETNIQVDLVILDLTIPGGEGAKKVIEKLKLINNKVKAVVTSGYSRNTVLLDYGRYGFKGAIYKPFKLSILSKEIYKVISLKDGEHNGCSKSREVSIS